jgi:hypothetical protein
MEPTIRRVLPEAAIQKGAVRPIGPRRERGAKREDEFADELARRAERDPRRSPPEVESEEHPTVRPPADGETGTHLDVTG